MIQPQFNQPGRIRPALFKAAGRITLPRPSIDESKYFLDSTRRTVSAVSTEVGDDRWNDLTQRWEGVGFQPPFDEAHAESQEYASGLIELVRIARDRAATLR